MQAIPFTTPVHISNTLGLLWGPRSPLLCATLCDIRRHWQFSKKSSVRRWAKLGDIERHWATLDKTEQQYPDNVKYYNSQIMHLHRKYNSKYQNII
jgi:hypothetical protein